MRARGKKLGFKLQYQSLRDSLEIRLQLGTLLERASSPCAVVVLPKEGRCVRAAAQPSRLEGYTTTYRVNRLQRFDSFALPSDAYL